MNKGKESRGIHKKGGSFSRAACENKIHVQPYINFMNFSLASSITWAVISD
jgi:hypothetical protein